MTLSDPIMRLVGGCNAISKSIEIVKHSNKRVDVFKMIRTIYMFQRKSSEIYC
jgi:hypothetical protein